MAGDEGFDSKNEPRFLCACQGVAGDEGHNSEPKYVCGSYWEFRVGIIKINLSTNIGIGCVAKFVR